MPRGGPSSHQLKIDASGMSYRTLNAEIRSCVADGADEIALANVCGQRYIATGLPQPVRIEIRGTAGNDLGAFMDGPRLEVFGNVQDGCGNTMNLGEIVVHGSAGDILAMSMRGGTIFIRDDAGYRAAVHMKEYQDRKPLLVIGGSVGDFFGEYMAGGTAIVLGLTGRHHAASFVGAGMHGGAIYFRGEVDRLQIQPEVAATEPDPEGLAVVEAAVEEYARRFKVAAADILRSNFIKLSPVSSRPYGKLYTY